MSDPLHRIAERQMARAAAEGQFRNLAGAGRPLPERPGDALIDTADAVACRIMAENGALPEEIALKRRVEAARAAWQAARAPAERKARMAELAEAQMRHEIAREARRRFFR